MDSVSTRALQNGTILSGKYRIDGVIGEGSFGVTYAAWDTIIQTKAAIKEYFPSEWATRNTVSERERSTRITVLTGEYEGVQYQKGLERFAREAENLAKLQKLPGIVSVRDFFHENNTAYMVMEYIDGITLEEYLKEQGGRISVENAVKLISPLMESLAEVHKAGMVHRDISPDNIMITREGELKLIDFGAARFVDGNSEKSLTVILKHGYAPEEQYRTSGKQGPWTDVYAFCAVVYRMVTGKVPPEASTRIMGDVDISEELRNCVGMSAHVNRVLQKGMAVNANKRYRDMKSLEAALRNGNRGRKALFASAGSLVALVCVAVIMVTLMLEKNDEKSLANKDTADNESAESKQLVSEIEEIPAIEEKTEEELIALIEAASGCTVIPEIQMREDVSFILDGYERFISDYKYRLYDDFDGDGRKEIFAYVYTKELEHSYVNHYPYAVSNTRLWYSDGIKTFQVAPSALDYISESESSFSEPDLTVPCGLNVLRFGRMQDVCEIYAYIGGQNPIIFCQTYHAGKNTVEPIIEFNRIGLGSDNEYKPLVFDLDRGLFMDFFDVILEDKYKSDNWEDWSGYLYLYYYIYELEGKYYIYNVNEIENDMLTKYSNYNEIIDKVETVLYCATYAVADFALWWDEPYAVQRKQVFISDNDKLYINYLLQTQPSVTPEEVEMWGYDPSMDTANNREYRITAIFSIKKDMLYLDGFMPEWMNGNIGVNNGEISMANNSYQKFRE